MKKGIVQTLSIAVASLTIAALFAACSTTPGTGGKTKVTITVSGSTSVQPIIQKLADNYSAENPNVSIDIQGGGSSAGIKAAQDGTSMIGTSSRELTDAEKAGLNAPVTIAIDCIAVLVNPANGVSNLTKDQVVSIFKGDIANWKDVGGADMPIIVVSRETGSGTRGAFEELLKLQSKDATTGTTTSLITAGALIADSSGAVKSNVSTKPGAIGYDSLGYVDSSVKAVSLDGVAPTTANVKSGTYIISRPFLLLTKGTVNADVQAFLDWLKGSAGQTIIAKQYVLP
jgi:phosphate transport system substrate-binding protein